jgi:hypothetical protein
MSFMSRLILRVGVGMAISCAALGATTAPDVDNDPVAFIADSQKVLDAGKSLPLLPAKNISQVVRFSEEGGMLTIDWPLLHSGPQTGRIPLTDLPGQATVACHGGALPGKPVYPTFEYWDLTQPDHLVRHLQVFSSPTFLWVFQDTEGVHDYLKTVSLHENIVPTDSPPVTLRIQIIDPLHPPRNIVLSANTLDELLLTHHEEFERYLRPMFSMFHQENAVFMMDDRIDWQVLAADWHSPADMAAKVNAIIIRFDSTEFAQRQNAEKDLQALGEPAALFLRTANRQNWSAEQTARVNAFLAEYFVLTDEQAQGLASDRDFLLECLGSDDADIRAAAVKHLDSVLGRKIDYILAQPPAERSRSISALHQNTTQ